MTLIVKDRTSLAIPPQLQRQAGIKPGDRVEVKVSGGVISIISELPSATDEYTRAQRRSIDAHLRQARKGPYYGPFDTPAETIAFLRKEVRSRRAAKRKTPPK